MRKSRFSETQIVAILKDQDAGVPTAELARRHGIHPNTLRTWRAKYGGLELLGSALGALRRVSATLLARMPMSRLRHSNDRGRPDRV
jgi:transposase-like protein